jgi:hypothetical protein
MKGAVLIIGSLYWDFHQGRHLNVRENWRNNHLQMNNRIRVSVPIRYGRTSGKDQKKVYTMVFSHSLQLNNLWGTAYAVPFKLDINDYQSLYEQAKYLSEAEGAKDSFMVKRSDGDIWCVIGIMFNPHLDEAGKQEILEKFQQQLDSEHLGEVYNDFCIFRETSILSRQGEILINWPGAVNPKDKGALDALDFILATCPKQNLEAYPDAASIKALVLQDNRNYFYQNTANGITTFQDREIVEAIIL